MMHSTYAQGVAAGPAQGYMQLQAFVPPLPDSQPPPPLPDEPPPPLPDGPPPEQAQPQAQLQGMAMQGHMQGVQPATAGTAYAAGNTGMQQMQPQQQTWDQHVQMQLPQQQAWGNGMGMQGQGMGTQQVGVGTQQQWGQQQGVEMGMQQLQGSVSGNHQWGQQHWGQQQQQWGQQMNMQQQWGQQHQYDMQQQGMMGQSSMMVQQGMQPQQMLMQQQMQLQQQQQQEYESQQALMQKQYQRQQEYQQMLMEKHQQQQQMQVQQTGYNQAGMGQWQQQQQQYMQGNGQQQVWPVAQQQMSQMPPPPRPTAVQQPLQMQQHLHPHNAQLQAGMSHAADMTAGHMQTPAAALAPPAMQQQLSAPAATAPAAAALEPPAPVDLRTLLQPPGRSQRPKRLLLILRGLPGSGKSYVAKAVRAKELEHSSAAPRLHSIDDYFMVDVENEVAADGSVVPANSSSSMRRQGSVGSKRRIVVEQEYQHDPDMEASYWKSLLRALGKTLASGDHSLVLLDAPAPKADQVKEAWMAAQSEGYEVMVVQPLTMDPEVCFKQNIHGRSLKDIKALASAFEPPPSMYTVATATSLFKEEGPGDVPIGDVDMTVDDAAAEQGGGMAAAGSPAKQQQKQKSSRWEDDGPDENTTGSAAAAVHGGSDTIADSIATAAADRTNKGTAQGVVIAADDGTGSSSRHKKKPKLSVQMNLDIDSEALLAGVNQALEQLDSDGVGSMRTPASAGRGLHDDVGRGDRGGSGRGAGSSVSMGGSYNSGTGKTGILKSAGTPGSSKKKVRWPDDVMQDAEVDQPTGFSIARPQRQLEEVFWVAGLGPKGCWLDDDQEDDEASVAAAGSAWGGAHAGREGRQVQQGLGGQCKHHNSFADQVRAEHKSEHNAFRAILLGHGPTAAGSQRQR